MIRISYQILENLHIAEKKVADDYVHYYWFNGNIKLQTDDGCVDASWEWIPIVDFAIFFKRISQSLSHKEIGCEEFGFTENDEYLELCRENDIIKIRPSFDGDTLIINFEEFCKEVDRFYNSVLEDVFNANPFLRTNKEFLRIVNNVN